MINKLTTKISALVIIALCMISCEGSRTRRMYESGKSAYEDYEETGDPTGLIIFIIGLFVIGVLWALSKKGK